MKLRGQFKIYIAYFIIKKMESLDRESEQCNPYHIESNVSVMQCILRGTLEILDVCLVGWFLNNLVIN